MKAFVLAAGKGERLRPLTDILPKPLAPVLNVPAICYALTRLRLAGINEVVINIHHLADRILRFFKEHDDFGFTVHFSHEPLILGTGGGLAECRSLLSDGPFLYVNSDTILDLDLQSIIDVFNESGCLGVMAVHPADAGSGRVAVAEGMVKDLRGILGSNQIPSYDFSGVAVLSQEIFKYLRHDFSDIVETGFISLVKRDEMCSFIHNALCHDIGTLESYRRANIERMKIIDNIAPSMRAAIGINPSIAAEGARIDASATVISSIVGDGAYIGADSFVYESVLLPGARVGANERCERRIVW